MALATSLRQVASKLTNKFGGTVTFRRVNNNAYNATTGTVDEINVVDTVTRGVLQDINLREVNDLVQATDKRLIIAAADLSLAPDTSDRVVIGGISHQIIRIDTIEQDNTAITYELILRV